MKWTLLLLSLIFLSGCGKSAPHEETFSETVMVSYLDSAYTITIGVPKDATEVINDNGRKIYRHEGGEYEIRTMVFSAENADSAIRKLMGEKKENMSVMETTRFSMPEYRFAWYDTGEKALLRADLVMDGTTCYAVIFSVDEQMGGKYDPLITEVFSTFGLHFDEGV